VHVGNFLGSCGVTLDACRGNIQPRLFLISVYVRTLRPIESQVTGTRADKLFLRQSLINRISKRIKISKGQTPVNRILLKNEAAAINKRRIPSFRVTSLLHLNSKICPDQRYCAFTVLIHPERYFI
jgi:hypothetical protein